MYILIHLGFHLVICCVVFNILFTFFFWGGGRAYVKAVSLHLSPASTPVCICCSHLFIFLFIIFNTYHQIIVVYARKTKDMF